MWDLGDEGKEPARERNLLAQSVSLQSLTGWVQFDAGAQIKKKPSSFKKHSIFGFKGLKSPWTVPLCVQSCYWYPGKREQPALRSTSVKLCHFNCCVLVSGCFLP